ncbi:Uncharacterised protein [Campylobacter jejuni]|nr:Uncharacterised protein [Campylobacter jejuni]
MIDQVSRVIGLSLSLILNLEIFQLFTFFQSFGYRSWRSALAGPGLLTTILIYILVFSWARCSLGFGFRFALSSFECRDQLTGVNAFFKELCTNASSFACFSSISLR